MGDENIDLKEVMRLTGLKRAQIYENAKAGIMPRQFRVGARAVRWSKQEIADWLQDRRTNHRSYETATKY